jgi:hypothetical protein
MLGRLCRPPLKREVGAFFKVLLMFLLDSMKKEIDSMKKESSGLANDELIS